jgi:hypothetical protein
MEAWLAGKPVPARDEIIARWGPTFLNDREAWTFARKAVLEEPSYDTLIHMHDWREEWIRRYGFAIPSAELIALLREHQPIVEIGAGSGYMTQLMRTAGIEVIGTDIGPRGYAFSTAEHDPYQEIMGGKRAVRHWRDRTVFCSWPTGDHTWFRQAIKAMRIGQRLIMVTDGSAAERTARGYLDCCFAMETDAPLPVWWPVARDLVVLYRKQVQNVDTRNSLLGQLLAGLCGPAADDARGAADGRR